MRSIGRRFQSRFLSLSLAPLYHLVAYIIIHFILSHKILPMYQASNVLMSHTDVQRKPDPCLSPNLWVLPHPYFARLLMEYGAGAEQKEGADGTSPGAPWAKEKGLSDG